MITRTIVSRRQLQKTGQPVGESKKLSHLKRFTFALGIAWLISHSAQADTTESTWTGGTSAVWSLPANWSPATVPSTTVSAEFNAAFTNQPTLGTTAATTQGIWVTGATANTTGVSGLVTIGGSGAGVLTIQGTATLDTVNTNTGILLDGTGNSSLTINAPASLTATNSTSFLVNNNGTLTLAGALTLTGGSNSLTLGGTGTGGSIVISGGMSGAGALIINTAGTVTLSGTDSDSGGVTLTAGTVNINNVEAVGAVGSTLNLNGGTINNTTAGTITLNQNQPIAIGGSFAAYASGSTATTNLNLGSHTLTDNGSYTITLNGTATTLTMSGVMTNTSGAIQTTMVSGSGNTLSLGGYALSNSATNFTDVINGSGNVTITGVVSNGGTATASGLTYSGSGVLTLGGTNTYAGGLSILSGTVVAGNASAAGSSADMVALGSSAGGATASASLLANSFTIANAINLGTTSGTLTIGNNGTTTAAIFSGAIALNGNNLTIAATGTTGTTTESASYQNSVYTGITGTGNLTINDADTGGTPGFVILGGNNNFAGTVTVSAGTLQLTSAGAYAPLNNTDTIALSSGTTFDINKNIVTIAGLSSSGTNGTVTNSAATAETLLLAGTGTYSFGGVVTSATPADLALAVDMPGGTQTLTGASTYTGITSLIAGTLNLGGGTSTGSLNGATGTALVLTGGTLDYTRTGGTTQTFTSTAIGVQPVAGATYFGGQSVVETVSGDTVALGAITRNTSTSNNTFSMANFGTAGTGTITTTTAAASNGIFGPWATIYNSSNVLSYATTTGSTPFTITNFAGAGAAGTNLGNMTVNLATNYVDSSSSGETLGANAQGYTLQYTGSGETMALGTHTLSLFGLLDSGTSGTLAITNTSGLGLSLAGANANSEFDLISNGQNITISSTITGGSNTVLVYGGPNAGTLELTGTLTFAGTGGVVIDGGQLQATTSTNLQNLSLTDDATNATGLTFSPSIGTFILGGLSGNGIINLADTASQAVALEVGNNNANTTFAGGLTGNGSLVKIGTGVLSIGQANSGYTYLDGANTYTGGTQILNGAIVVNSNQAGNSPFGTGNVTIGASSGIASAGLYLSSSTIAAFNNTLVVASGGAGEVTIGQDSGGNSHFYLYNNITLNRNANLVNNLGSQTNSQIYGNISGAGTLSLIINGGYEITDGAGLNGINTYTGGTYVDGGQYFIGTTTSSLGTGNVTINGGTLSLGSTTSVASGKTVTINPGGSLAIPTGSSTYTQSYLATLINSASSGGGLEFQSGFGGSIAALNMAALGNGTLFLGGYNGGTPTYSQSNLGAGYTNASLGAAGGYTYYLGSEGGEGSPGAGSTSLNFTLSGTNVLGSASTNGSAASVIIGSPLAGAPYVAYGAVGYVYLTAANNYTGTTTVNEGSTLNGTAQTGVLTPFGTTTAGMTLNGGSLILTGAATGTTTNIGTLTFDGGASLAATAATSGTNALVVANLSRTNQGTLAITLNPTNSTITFTAGAPTATAGMIAPYFLDAANGAFLNYSSGVFSDATLTPVTGASGITGSTTNNVQLTGATTTTSSATVNSLNLNGQTLTLAAGGQILTVTSGGVTFGSGTGTIATPLGIVQFGATGTSEGVIDVASGKTGTINATLQGSGGLTKTGAGTLVLTDDNSDNGEGDGLSGVVTIDQGTLQVSSDAALGVGDGSAATSVLINGGTLNLAMSSGTISANRGIAISNNGATITDSNNATNSITIAGAITGTAPFLSFATNGSAGGSTNDTIILSNTGNTFTAPIYIDQQLITSPITYASMTLSIGDDRELGNAANNITISDLATLQETGNNITTARAISFTNGGGNIDVTGSNTYTVSGTISGDGIMTKTDTGTLVLTGNNTLSGNTIVAGGTLYANNATSSTGTGMVGVGNTATLSGTGTIAPTGINGVTVASGGSVTPGGVQTAVGTFSSYTGVPTNTVNGKLTLNTAGITASSTILGANAGSGLTFALGAGGAGATNSANSVSQLLVTGNVANIMNFNIGGTGSTSTVVTINDLIGDAVVLGTGSGTEYVLIQGNNTTYEDNGVALSVGAGTLGASTALGQQILGGLSLLSTPNNNYFSNSYAGSELFLQGDNIVIAAVPEPSTWALMLGGLGLLVFFQRRKRNQSAR